VATEKQYQHFKSIFDAETARQGDLEDRAKSYLSLITFYSAFIAFVVQNERPDTLTFKTIFLLIVASMGLAFLLSLLSIRVTKYEIPSDPKEIINNYKTSPPSDDDFFDDRIIDYVVASQRNAAINDRKARLLIWAGYCVLVGISLHALYIFLRFA
jgi:hypothetical protein